MITPDGTVTVLFTNGTSQDIYRVPLVEFLNVGELAQEGLFVKEMPSSGPPVLTVLDSAATLTTEIHYKALEMDVN